MIICLPNFRSNPLICAISGEKLGSMCDPVAVKHEGKEFRLCSDHCVTKFQSAPTKHAALVK